jgi:hypothetical protein
MGNWNHNQSLFCSCSVHYSCTTMSTLVMAMAAMVVGHGAVVSPRSRNSIDYLVGVNTPKVSFALPPPGVSDSSVLIENGTNLHLARTTRHTRMHGGASSTLFRAHSAQAWRCTCPPSSQNASPATSWHVGHILGLVLCSFGLVWCS